ncbi:MULTISPECIES: Rpn family recombination-promoting nuclease/putative transposase [unclassified Serratia]|uniref:Rpn family recombination-promoting nuclease/putative transposase n=1 Tax=unclassified Serratia (in: enterobacteria) TaxID=2647522 RepID=UPI00046A8B32
MPVAGPFDGIAEQITDQLAPDAKSRGAACCAHYLLQAGSTTKPERLIRELARRAPRHEEELMTIAEYLEQKGREEGRQEGKHEASLEIARSMLAREFDPAVIKQLTGLSEEELAQIHQ